MFSAIILTIPNFIWIFAFAVNFANPQIVYLDNYSACQYNVSGKLMEFQNETQYATFGSLQLYYNFCNNLTELNGCDDAAMVCVKKSESKFIPNAGSSFTPKDSNQLVAIGNTSCTNNTYKSTITFDVNLIEKKTFLIKGCEIMITVNPTPKCTVNINGFSLDLSPLSRLGDISVKTNKTYSLGICNYSAKCGKPYSGCILGTEEEYLISFDMQKVDYDYAENKLIVKAKSTKSKKPSQIYINCNWFETLGKTEKLNRKYDFAIESKYGCVKLPTNCSVIKNDKYSYNIDKLNRPSGWNINVPEGVLTINVCGPLKQYKNTECSNIYSQVCLKTNDKYIGYGSLAKPLKASELQLEMDILYGSKCPINTSLLLETKIKFECSRIEKGPKIVNTTEVCVYHILWQTPEACPKNLDKEKNFAEENAKQQAIDCRVGDFFDLNPLVLNTDNYKVEDDSGNVFHINLCRPLFINNDTYACQGNAACMDTIADINVETKYTAFGSAKVPKFIKDTLMLNYDGGWWQGFAHEIEIKFRCSKDSENKIHFYRRTNSKIEFVWNTALVCQKSLLECHKIFNFDKITTPQFSVTSGSLKYNFNLCDSVFSLTSLETGESSRQNANTSLTHSSCIYTLKYELTNSNICDDPHRLNTFYLSFACNTRTTDYFEKESTDNCIFRMKFWTSQACNIFKDTIDSECKESDENFETIAGGNVLLTPRNCSINVFDGTSLDLNSLTPFKVVSKNGNIYEIANKTSTCGGFICKNDEIAGSTDIVCPSSNIDLLSQRYIQISFIGSACNKEMYKTALMYKCRESQSDLPRVLSESSCNATIEVPDDFVCKKLQLNITSHGETNGGVIAGIVILCIIIVTVVGVLVWQYLKRNNYISLNKSRVYIRNLRH